MIDPSKLCQIEFCVANPQKTVEFMQSVFGWTASPAELQEYIIIDVPEECPYGISVVAQSQSETRAQPIVLYFAVHEIEKVIDRAKKNGAQIRFGPKKLPGYGTIYQINAPDGLRFGIFEKN